MTTSYPYLTGSIATLMTTELNSLTNTSFATASSAYDNSNGDEWGDFELYADAGGNFTDGGACNLYLLTAPDGTNYPTTTKAPAGNYAGTFITGAEHPGRYMLLRVQLPPCKFKTYLQNSSGQNFAASGNTLKMLPYRTQQVTV